MTPLITPRPRILLVDDNRAIHEDFRKILGGTSIEKELEDAEADLLGERTSETRPQAFDLDSAYQGEDALKLVLDACSEGRPYGMAFMDVRMPPGWDGIETTARIWKAYPDLQVVICTAFSDFSWNEIIAKVGQTDRLVILKKPFDNAEVLQLANALTVKWQLLQDTRQHVSTLEERVRERTQELEASAAKLRAEIDERNRIEIQLRHAQKMESIGQLAAGIAHEINTPTQFIGDNTRFARDSFTGIREVLARYEQVFAGAESNGIQPEQFSAIRTAVADADLDFLLTEVPTALQQALDGVDRIAQLVKAMKEFSHPGTTEKTLTDLNHAIDTTLTVCRNEWKYQAELTKDFDPDLPQVPCHPGDFNQVILNLVVNAAHAMDENSRSGIKGLITVTTRRSEDQVEIRIGDNGSGIPEGIRERVFDPFFTTKGVGRGTGQGLAIARSIIVDKHQGTISFESTVGQGTTFIVRLPLCAESS